MSCVPMEKLAEWEKKKKKKKINHTGGGGLK